MGSKGATGRGCCIIAKNVATLRFLCQLPPFWSEKEREKTELAFNCNVVVVVIVFLVVLLFVAAVVVGGK